MYLAVDIGGTKTLLACFSPTGNLKKSVKFPTANSYSQFLTDLMLYLKDLETKDYDAGCVAIPGIVDRRHGRGVKFGNLPWKNVPIEADVEKLIEAPVIVENDAKVGGFYEALLTKNEFNSVVYVTLGTGIGISLIVDGVIDIKTDDMGGHSLMVHNNGKTQSWESLTSGKAIVKQFGKRAEAITDDTIWHSIARNLAVGLMSLISKYQPDAIIMGGGVGKYFENFANPLNDELKRFQTPLSHIPAIRPARRPEESVIYGCYELAKVKYGLLHKTKVLEH